MSAPTQGEHSTSVPPNVLQSALTASITTGVFPDTAYHLYSRRVSGSKIGVPRIVYANSTVLTAAGDYFRAQLSGGFDSQRCLEAETDSYDYEDDSDVDDFDVLQQIVESSEERNINTSEQKCGDADIGKNDEMQVAKSTAYSIAVPDIAYTTWLALIHYIYTGSVSFAPLKSQGIQERTHTVEEHRRRNPNNPRPCSPKSMYRVADIVGLDKLKMLAKDDISRKLSSQTIVDETFSYISSIYPEMLDLQLTYLYDKGLISQVMPAMQQKLNAAAGLGIPQIVNVMGAIILRLSLLLVKQQSEEKLTDTDSVAGIALDEQYKTVVTSSGTLFTRLMRHQRRGAVQSAIFASLVTGTFCDTVYHLHSRRVADGKVGVLRVLYASSIVIKHSTSSPMIARLSTDQLAEKTDAYGYDEDSDIEDAEHLDASAMQEPPKHDEPSEGYPPSCNFQQNSRTLRHIMIPDLAAKTWETLLYYIYTGEINFTSLKSRRSIQPEVLQDDQSPRCSPKSMYRLASMLHSDELKRLAKSEIQRQLSEHNITDEVFSRFSSSYPEILDVELNFLYENALMSRVMPILRQKLARVAEGELSHAEHALDGMITKLSLLLAQSVDSKAESSNKKAAITPPNMPKPKARWTVPKEY